MQMVLLKSSDETVSQIKSKVDSQTDWSGGDAWDMRDSPAAADGSAAKGFPGERSVAAVPLPESAVRMPIGGTVLEEMLLLQ